MKNIFLFDLDSTLLQMDQDLFLKKYFEKIILKTNDPKFMKIFNDAALAILDNDGSITNEELFWNYLSKYYPDTKKYNELFNDFYNNEFKEISSIVNKNDIPRQIIDYLKSKGYIIILATNPLFPKICTYERISWAGLSYKDFDYITTYENCTYCKPKKEYYLEIFNKLNLDMNNAVMIGNDLMDDFYYLPSEIDKVLITDHLINSKNLEITMPCFTLIEFLDYIKIKY